MERPLILMRLMTQRELPMRRELYDLWTIAPPCLQKDDPFCHTLCPWFGGCAMTKENIDLCKLL